MSEGWVILALLVTVANAANIDLLECNPPHTPIGGDYGPKQTTYKPGDTILYYCEVDSFIGGNFLRKCEDTGRWTGEAPVCDSPSAFESSSQTSTADDISGSEFAFDGLRDTCSSTEGRSGDEWYGVFLEPGELIRVMLFLPKGPVSFEVVLVKANGEEIVCGSQTLNIVRYDWIFQNCPGPHNLGATGVKIKSLSTDPLKICELQAYVLTSPKCTDPRLSIENGHLSLSRKVAVLNCDKGYLRSRNTQLDCMRDGEWNSKNLYCNEPVWEEPINTGPVNPDRERERISVTRDSP